MSPGFTSKHKTEAKADYSSGCSIKHILWLVLTLINMREYIVIFVIVLPNPSVICLIEYTGWKDQRHCSIAASAHNRLLVQVMKLNVKCSLYCWRCLHPASASTSDWEGSVIECFPGLHHTGCRSYRKDRLLCTALWISMITPHRLPEVSLNRSSYFFFSHSFHFYYRM